METRRPFAASSSATSGAAFVIAVGLVRDENDAREIVQEAFLRVYRGLASFQGGSSFFTWLYRIVTNLSIDLMRKPGRREAELVDNQLSDEEPNDFPLISRIDGSDPLDVIRRREIAGRIQAALDALPSYHRGVILMREVEGMSYEEMAQAMGVSKGTIMSRLFHARQKLQRALADCYAEQGLVALPLSMTRRVRVRGPLMTRRVRVRRPVDDATGPRSRPADDGSDAR